MEQAASQIQDSRDLPRSARPAGNLRLAVSASLRLFFSGVVAIELILKRGLWVIFLM
jgi:hypothetical protein